MAKTYSLSFGTGDPRSFTGLNATFLIFVRTTDGQTIAPPSITESLTSSGLYQFTWGTTQPIAFLADAATTSPGTSARYITGQLDPADSINEIASSLMAQSTSLLAQSSTLFALGSTNIAIGTTNIAIGTTNIAFGTTNVAIGTTILSLINGMSGPLDALIGSTASTFGTENADPVDLFGYLKRVLENLEGDSLYTKGSGSWQILSRGSSTLLRVKTLTNSVSLVTKTGL